MAIRLVPLAQITPDTARFASTRLTVQELEQYLGSNPEPLNVRQRGESFVPRTATDTVHFLLLRATHPGKWAWCKITP